MANIKKVGVLFSGGVESTFLLYETLLKYDNVVTLSENLNDVSYFTSRMIERLEKITNKKVKEQILMNFEYTVIDNEQNIKEDLHDVYRRYIIENNVDLVFAGTNAYYDEVPSWAPRRDVRSETVKQPYFDMLKHEVMEKFYEHKIEHLLEHCHSCLHQTKDFVCGECFNCRERKYAETRLDSTIFTRQ